MTELILTCLSDIMIKFYFWIGMVFERLMSETPYLIHDTTKAPHITGSGVLLVMNSLYFKETYHDSAM